MRTDFTADEVFFDTDLFSCPEHLYDQDFETPKLRFKILELVKVMAYDNGNQQYHTYYRGNIRYISKISTILV